MPVTLTFAPPLTFSSRPRTDSTSLANARLIRSILMGAIGGRTRRLPDDRARSSPHHSVADHRPLQFTETDHAAGRGAFNSISLISFPACAAGPPIVRRRSQSRTGCRDHADHGSGRSVRMVTLAVRIALHQVDAVG
jgi:hypothetical protein